MQILSIYWGKTPFSMHEIFQLISEFFTIWNPRFLSFWPWFCAKTRHFTRFSSFLVKPKSHVCLSLSQFVRLKHGLLYILFRPLGLYMIISSCSDPKRAILAPLLCNVSFWNFDIVEISICYLYGPIYLVYKSNGNSWKIDFYEHKLNVVSQYGHVTC